MQKINLFEMSELKTCLWCNYAGLFFNTDDKYESVVCLHGDTRKLQKKDRPTNREFRTYLKVMCSDELCEHWTPTKVGSDRMEMLRLMGFLGEQVDE